MAKKTTTKYQITAIAAFVALFLSAIIWLLNGVNALGSAAGVLNLIKDICLLAAVALASHNFAKGLGKVWYIIYWIVVVIAILGLIFGVALV